MNLSEIKELIASTPCRQIKSGAAAYFIQASSEWGVKFFMPNNKGARECRNLNYDKQSEFYDLQLAPKLGNKFDFTLYKKGISHDCISGFITESVETFGDDLDDNVVYCDDNDDWYDQETEFLRKSKWGRLWEILISKIESHGMNEDMLDLHTYNWGLAKNGEPVVIDFSHIHKGKL